MGQGDKRPSVEHRASSVYEDIVASLGASDRATTERHRPSDTAGADLFRVLADNVPGTVYLCRNDETYSMLYLSQDVEALTGVPSERFLAGDASFVDLYHPRDVEKVFPGVDEALERRVPFHIQYRLRHASGEYREVEEFGQGVWDDDGKLAFLEGAIFDITEKKRIEREQNELERQLLQTQKLESLGLLAGGIAHDFNNLLQAIVPNLIMALEDLAPADPCRPLVDEALSAAQQAAGLTKQMLAYAGQAAPAPRPFDGVALVKELLPLLRGGASKKVTIDFESSSPRAWAPGDPVQVRQVVMNLALNACEAIGEAGGRVRLRVGESGSGTALDALNARNAATVRWFPAPPPRTDASQRWLSVIVADEGNGMDAETLDHVFDPFFTTKVTGHGLGLAAALGIVKGHGGHLGVSSTPGDGTTFALLLAAGDAPGGADEVRTQPRPTGMARPRAREVLIVDDEAEVRRTIQRVLERSGFRTESVDSGQAALSAVHDGLRPDAVVLDMSMPELNGAETFAALRAAGIDAPVLFVSGYDHSATLGDLAHEPSTGFLLKPHHPNDLVHALDRLLADASERR